MRSATVDDEDIIRLEDLAAVRAETARTERKVIWVSVAIGPAAGMLVVALVYLIHGKERLDVGCMVGVLFALMSIPQAVHWVRHYRSIKSQLDRIEVRLTNGERVRASEVEFRIGLD